jgi:hypothetical protein
MRFMALVLMLSGCSARYWRETAGQMPVMPDEHHYFIGVRPRNGVLTGEPFPIQTR